MDRNEAVLRELNLYPQWTLRAPVEKTVAAPIEVVDAEAPSNIPTIQNSDPHLPAAMPFIPASSWTELKQQVRDCQRCGLRAGCTQTVFGMGDEQADWLFVGDMPRADEDALGEPFAGAVGQLLDNMLAAIKLKRGKNAYLANVVKCRPAADTHPHADEIAQCLPLLQRQIELLQPKLIVALGKVAATNLLGEELALDDLRGSLHDYNGIPVIVTYHPAYLLRKPTAKAQAWQDLCFAVDVMREV